ncbi:hypothetical protein LguiA_005441 [Lonicera macranthoides]
MNFSVSKPNRENTNRCKIKTFGAYGHANSKYLSGLLRFLVVSTFILLYRSVNLIFLYFFVFLSNCSMMIDLL